MRKLISFFVILLTPALYAQVVNPSGAPTTAQVQSAINGQVLAPSTVSPTVAIYGSPEVPYNADGANTGVCTTAATIKPSNGNNQRIVLTAGSNCVLSFTLPATNPINITVRVIQGNTGSFNGTISDAAACHWSNGVVPTITAASGATDWITFHLTPTDCSAMFGQNFIGN